jgi:hypothetical protein
MSEQIAARIAYGIPTLECNPLDDCNGVCLSASDCYCPFFIVVIEKSKISVDLGGFQEIQSFNVDSSWDGMIKEFIEINKIQVEDSAKIGWYLFADRF